MSTDGLKVLFVTSELAPFSKTGGLADVSAALPKALARLGCDIRILTPFYGSISREKFLFAALNGKVPSSVSFHANELPIEFVASGDWDRSAYFLCCDALFDRPGIYVDPFSGKDYLDNDYRFLTLSQAAYRLCDYLDWIPDIVHANDWQSAPAAHYLTLRRAQSGWRNTRSLLTLHNLAYHGLFPVETVGRMGGAESLYFPGGPIEFYGHVSFLKSGILMADALNTVSPTYAREIQSSYDFAFGLENVLRESNSHLQGILNGIDTEVWNPETDTRIPHRYSSEKPEGKRFNKQALCGRVGFPVEDNIPILGIVSRIAHQKGFEILAPLIPEILGLPARVVILGSGEPYYEHMFYEYSRVYPDRFAVRLAYDEDLSHLIEAGSDIFLMPSKFEPCGLNQMMSMIYGTVPVVRATGGLADTVVDADFDTLHGTGFVFQDYNSDALWWAIRRANSAYHHRERWTEIQKRGMSRDFSWQRSASSYLELYRDVLSRPVRFA